MLVAAGADPNARDYRDRTPLHSVVKEDNVEVVRALLAAGADVNAKESDGSNPWIPKDPNDGKSPLHFATAPEVIAVLVRGGGRREFSRC